MIKINDIHYIAGLLEGEGCFFYNQDHVRISLEMTDLDTVIKARNIMSPSNRVLGPYKSWRDTKRKYRLIVNGYKAVGWMMVLYPLMSIRRKSKIKEVILLWRNTPCRQSKKLRRVA